MADKFNYNKTLATSRRLISKFGAEIQLIREYSKTLWESEYDAVEESFTWKNISTGAIQTTEPIDEVSIAQGVLIGIDESLLENSLVEKSDSMLLTVEIPDPAVGDTFLVNGKNWKYVAHETISPTGLVLLYKVALRI